MAGGAIAPALPQPQPPGPTSGETSDMHVGAGSAKPPMIRIECPADRHVLVGAGQNVAARYSEVVRPEVVAR
eukprot:1071300-Pyramimonas_sp.AAC.1